MEARIKAGRIADPAFAFGIRWSVAHAAKNEGCASGDGYLIKRSDAVATFAVADGTGSGVEAEEAKDICLSAIAEAEVTDLSALFERSHQALIGSRGVALAVVNLDLSTGRLDWGAVGDVDGALFRPAGRRKASAESIVQRGGVLGSQHPGVHLQAHHVAPGDAVVLVSDGVSRRYRSQLPCADDMAAMAGAIIERFGRKNDDKIVLAIEIEDGAA